MLRLVRAVQDLSQVRTLEQVQTVVRSAARELTGADGASFVLRQGDRCFYADEDAIGPLWKGQSFPLTACVSGWAMMHRATAVIPDIYRDARVPTDAYRPTFVKSMVMAPVRTQDPIGAIGNYWATTHEATPQEVRLLEALANTTAVALENVQLYRDLERRIEKRTEELQSANRALEIANRELDAFAASVAHDLRSPLSAIIGFSQMALEDFAPALPPPVTAMLQEVALSGQQLARIISDLLAFSREAARPIDKSEVHVGALVADVIGQLRRDQPGRLVEIQVGTLLPVFADPSLLRQIFVNLLSNAFKFTARTEAAVVAIDSRIEGDEVQFSVRDNGAGFDMAEADRLFQAFRRLHTQEEFAGTGIGLSLVQRIVHRHGGRVWAEGEPGRGATFHFTIAGG